jgi:hypothetical protein
MTPRLVEVARTADGWLFFLGACCLTGGGHVVNVNLAQICEAAGHGRAGVAVSLFAVGGRPWDSGLQQLFLGPKIVMLSISFKRGVESFSWDHEMMVFVLTRIAAVQVGNGLGRLASGALSDLAHRRRWLPRPLCLGAAALAMVAVAPGVQRFGRLNVQPLRITFMENL